MSSLVIVNVASGVLRGVFLRRKPLINKLFPEFGGIDKF